METNDIERRGKRWMSNSLLMMIFAYAIVNSTMSVLLNEIIGEFGLIGVQEGLMNSLISLGGMAALLAILAIQGRIGKPAMILLSGAVSVLMLLGIGAAPTLPLLLMCCLLQGVGNGFIDGYVNSAMVDVHGGQSAKYMGALHGCFGVGSLLAPLAIVWMLGSLSWRAVYGVVAGVYTLFLLEFALASRKAAGSMRQGSMREARLAGADMLAYARRPRNLLLIAASMLYGVTQAGLSLWSVRYFTVQHGDAVLGAAATSAFWVCCTISRFAAPLLRLRPLQLIIGGCLGAAVTLAIGVLSGNATVMLAMTGLNGLISGACLPMLLAESTRGYEGRTSLPTSMTLLFATFGRTLLPLTVGWLTAAANIRIAMLFPAAAGLVAAVLAFFAKEAPREA